MAYAKRSKARVGFRRRFKRPVRVNYRRPATTYRNRHNIGKLSGAVMRLQRKLSSRYSFYQLTYQFPAVDLVYPYRVWQLTNPNFYTSVFGAPGITDERRAFYSRKLNLDMMLSSATEDSPIDVTIFIVSAKSGACNQLMAEAGENLASMNPGGIAHHYVEQSGRAFMNPKVFNIHHVKRCIIGTNVTDGGTPSKNISDANKRMYLKIPWNRRIVNGIAPGDVGNLNFSKIEDGCKLWCIAYNNNYGVDAQYPTLAINSLWSVKC